MKELNDILGIKTKLSTAYHPQTDGQTKQVNQEIEQYLSLCVSHKQNNWPEWITSAEFAYNNKIHTATQISPFYMNYGHNPGWELNLDELQNLNQQKNLLSE